MFRVLLISLTILGLSSAQTIVVPNDSCRWRGAGYGQDSNCAVHEVAVASCGSGRDSDCNWISGFMKQDDLDDNHDEAKDSGIYHGLECCVLPNYEYNPDDCMTHPGDFGEDLSCPELMRGPNWIVEGECGSGRDPDCGSNAYHKVNCCEGFFDLYGNATRVPLTNNLQCYWKYADYGKEVRCNIDDEAIFGRCGSGRDADCEGGNYHGIQCCQLIYGPPINP